MTSPRDSRFRSSTSTPTIRSPASPWHDWPIAYRQRFGKDFLIDLVGYRRWGHNEGDEPTFTQPRMYATVTQHPTVRQRFAEQLAAEGAIGAEDAAGMLQATLDGLAATRKQVVDTGSATAPFDENGKHDLVASIETGVPADDLRAYDVGDSHPPAGDATESEAAAAMGAASGRARPNPTARGRSTGRTPRHSPWPRSSPMARPSG